MITALFTRTSSDMYNLIQEKYSMKIKPSDVKNDHEEFDDLNELHNVDYTIYHRSKNKKRYKKKSTKRLITDDKDLYTSKNFFTNLHKFLITILISQNARKVGTLLFSISLLISMMIELCIPSIQRYNIMIILGLLVSIEFQYFPKGIVRPQIILSLLVIISIAIDVFQIITNPLSIFIIVLFGLLIVIKILLLNVFFHNSTSGSRTRKYLNRRFRLFMIPLYQPRRIMRDIRGRMIAIGWISLLAMIQYICLFGVMYFYFEYKYFTLNESAMNSLPFYLFIKGMISFILLLGILYDTDIILSLWYFGCMGYAIKYVRNYIKQKRLQYNGWPLIFSFTEIRFYIFFVMKLLDLGFSIYGWIILSHIYGGVSIFDRIRIQLKILIVIITITILVYDIWCISLLFGIRWLLKRQKTLKKMGILEVSDDSEIEEFQLRTNIEEYREQLIEDEVVNELHRKLYLLRMKEEHIRNTEYTSKKMKKTNYKSNRNAIVPWHTDEDNIENGNIVVLNDDDNNNSTNVIDNDIVEEVYLHPYPNRKSKASLNV